jgi:LysM repeat protein
LQKPCGKAFKVFDCRFINAILIQTQFLPYILPARLRKEIKMTKLLRSFLVSTLILMTLASCSLTSTAAQTEIALATPTLAPTTIELAVKADATSLTAVGQIIKYTYTVKNTGAAAVPGPAAVTGATCPEINSVGNLDANFDAGETFDCKSEYTVIQADLDKGSVVTITIATVSGVNSNAVTTMVTKAQPAVLNLTKTANPVTYDQVGQIITYTYVIMNSGTTPLGPAQFTVTDTGFSAPINCGDAAATIAPAATLTCTTPYTISQADMDTGSVSTSATASGGGAAASPSVSATVTKGAVVVNPSNSTLTAGSTIQHRVTNGEWVWQIARCYGADTAKVIQSNPQLPNPGYISPDTIITVPNIGSVSKIYGPPCVGTHTVQSGDTWESIALKYNADVTVLKMVNKYVFTIGQTLTVPLNSAGGVLSLPK